MTKAERIAETLKNEYGIAVELKTVNKDGIERQAVVLGDGNIRPAIYPECMDGNDYDICAEAIRVMETTAPDINVEDITDWNKAKYRLNVAVAPAGRFPNLATAPYLDLEMYAEVHVTDSGIVKVTEQLLDGFGISKDELFETAIANTNFVIRPMGDVIKEITAGIGLDADQFPPSPFYVCTKKSSVNGAGAITDPQTFKPLAFALGTDLIILPSSIHEVLLLPADDRDIEGLRAMVKGINETEVAPEERLSDNVYIYRRSTNTVEIA